MWAGVWPRCTGCLRRTACICTPSQLPFYSFRYSVFLSFSFNFTFDFLFFHPITIKRVMWANIISFPNKKGLIIFCVCLPLPLCINIVTIFSRLTRNYTNSRCRVIFLSLSFLSLTLPLCINIFLCLLMLRNLLFRTLKLLCTLKFRLENQSLPIMENELSQIIIIYNYFAGK